jgi:hypothetical protein
VQNARQRILLEAVLPDLAVELPANIQRRSPTQLIGLPGPGAGGDPTLFVRFCYASANEQGWSIGNTNSNLETGSIPGGGSRPLCA